MFDSLGQHVYAKDRHTLTQTHFNTQREAWVTTKGKICKVDLKKMTVKFWEKKLALYYSMVNVWRFNSPVIESDFRADNRSDNRIANLI